MKPTILLMDNVTEFLETQSRLLERAYFHVHRVETIAKAERVLQQEWVHLAILDIRMEDEDDENDISGLILAQKEQYRFVPKIILTGYPSYETAVEALGPIDGYPSAIDYVAKGKGSKFLLERVKLAFDQHIRINWDLDIRWGQERMLSFPYLLALIEKASPNEYLLSRIEELEDLFRRLFHDYKQITISRLLWSKGHQLALEVFAYSKEKDEQFVVTCSNVEKSRIAKKLYAKHSPNEFQANITSKALYAETMRYGAIAWALIGAELEDAIPFSTFFYQKPDRQIRTTMENLYQSTLRTWYSTSFYLEEEKSLAQAYCERVEIAKKILDPMKLSHKIKALSKEALTYKLQIKLQEHEIHFRFPNGEISSYPNPIPYITNNIPLPESQVLFGNSLGNLDPDILLVNRNCESWVTDFTQSGPAPIWFDFIDMENHIRFSLMDIDDLFRLYEFEKQLMSMQRLSEIIPPGDVDTEDRKALNAIQTVRHMAASFFSDELIPYYIGLLFCSAKGFETYDHDVRETKRRTLSTIHRLLFSAMLCQHFAQISEHLSQNDVIENVHPIHIDEENKEVSIGERVITLTPTEYGLFLYLYNHAEKLCQREKLLSNVFNYQDLDPVAGKSLLNTHISRLRHKIESDPSNPKYILTIRGRGYKLKILPE